VGIGCLLGPEKEAAAGHSKLDCWRRSGGDWRLLEEESAWPCLPGYDGFGGSWMPQ
jgi:hypothetical protein